MKYIYKTPTVYKTPKDVPITLMQNGLKYGLYNIVPEKGLTQKQIESIEITRTIYDQKPPMFQSVIITSRPEPLWVAIYQFLPKDQKAEYYKHKVTFPAKRR